MDEVEQTFVEGMGLISEEDGMPRIGGQIFGLLMLREDALSLDEIAAELQVSKASVSTNARLLTRMGAIERTSKPGDRRDFYRITPNAPERGLDGVVNRMNRMVSLLDTTLCQLPDARREQKRRLAMLRDWHEFLLEEIDATMERWRARRKARETSEESP
jgi:DNA-binding transcriptional regulator GbsR (MarR family)